MKSVISAVAFAAVLAMQTLGNVQAQAQAPAPSAPAAVTPAAEPPAAPSAAAPPADATEKKSPSRSKTRSGERADARACLEFADNLQVIKCAEKYRYARAPA